MNHDDPYLIISADCHAGLPTAQYRPYLEQDYHDRFDEFLDEQAAILAQRGEEGQRNEEFEEEWNSQEGTRGGWDSARRDLELDGDGVAGEVIFPDSDAVTGTSCPPFAVGIAATGDQDPELAFAGAMAHNRWLAELCAESPDRRAGVALVPMVHDVDRAVRVITECRDMGLRGGIMIPAMWGAGRPYHDEIYDPVWAACADLEMPVHVHSGPAPREEYGDNIGIYVSEVLWWAARPLRFMLWGGVFERHPRLKFVTTESGAYWASDMLWKMYTHWESIGGGSQKLAKQISATLTKSPVAHFDDNCFLGATTRRVEIGRRYQIGIGNLMWGNDFPHPEGTWPHTEARLKETFHDVPVAETRRMLGLNQVDVYGFDPSALASIVTRIGPTPADLGQDDTVSERKWATAKAVGRWWETGADTADAATVL